MLPEAEQREHIEAVLKPIAPDQRRDIGSELVIVGHHLTEDDQLRLASALRVFVDYQAFAIWSKCLPSPCVTALPDRFRTIIGEILHSQGHIAFLGTTEWKSILALIPDVEAAALARRLIEATSARSCPANISVKIAAETLLFLPEHERDEIAHSALSILRRHNDEAHVLVTLRAMLALLPEDDQLAQRAAIARLADQFVAEFPVKTDPGYLHIGLMLLPCLGDDQAADVAEALFCTQGKGQITTLCKVAPYLRVERKAEAIGEITALTHEYGTKLSAQTLREARPWLPDREFEQIWQKLCCEVTDIADDRQRAKALARLIGVAPSERVMAIAAAFLGAAAAASAWDEDWCCELRAMVACTDPTWLETQLLPIVSSFSGKMEPIPFAWLLIELAGRLDSGYFPKLLSLAHAVAPFDTWTVALQIAAARLMNDEAATAVLAGVLNQNTDLDRAELLENLDLLMPLVARLAGRDAVKACWTSLREAASALP